MSGESLMTALGGLTIFRLAMLMMKGGTSAPDSLRFTSMVAEE